MKVTDMLSEVIKYRKDNDSEGFRWFIKGLDEEELMNLREFAQRTVDVCNSRLRTIKNKE